MLNLKKSAVLAGLGLVLATSAFAAPNSVYVRAEAGYATNKFVITTEDPKFSVSKGKLTYGLGLGYQFDNNFRADVTVHRTKVLKFKGADNAVANFYSNLFLANVYYDFASMSESFVPYVTAGLGFGNYSAGNAESNKDFASSKNRFAYALGLGAAYKISDQVSLDVGYKFSQTRFNKNEGGKFNNNQFLAGVRFSF